MNERVGDDAGGAGRRRTATIRDVAHAAQVSITTVSHVFNQPHRVAERTRNRVLSAAAKLAYQPNIHAQQLVTRRSRCLAMFSAGRDRRQGGVSIANSEYHLDVLGGATLAAADNGYALIMVPSDVVSEKLESFAVDGLFVVDPTGDESIFGRARIPAHVVTVGRAPALSATFSTVDNDHSAAAEQVMEHLTAEGCSMPSALVAGRAGSRVLDMLDGYRDWMTRHGRAPVVVDLDSFDSMASAFDHLLAAGGDAVYASSEHIALDAVGEARRRGIAVPGALAVCSAVDSGVLQLTSPQVTGVSLDPHQIGRRGIELLIGMIEGGVERGSDRDVPFDLVLRGSTLRRAGGG